jgi:hypothetical protein
MPFQHKVTVDGVVARINKLAGIGSKIPETARHPSWTHVELILQAKEFRLKQDQYRTILIAAVVLSSVDRHDLCNQATMADLVHRKVDESNIDSVNVTVGRIRYDLQEYFKHHPEETDVISLPEGFKALFQTRPQPQLALPERTSEEELFHWINERPHASKLLRGVALNEHRDVFTSTQLLKYEAAALCLGTVVRLDGRTVLLLPSMHSISDTGRTAVLLAMLHLMVPYERFIGVEAFALPAESALQTWGSATNNLIASDKVYCAVQEEGLWAIPIRGEPADFMWDFARHLYRSTQMDYSPGMSEMPPHREYILDLFRRLPFGSGLFDCYSGNWSERHSVDEIVIVELKLSERNRNEVYFEDTQPNLISGFQPTATHTSPFWVTRREHVEVFIEKLRGIRLDPGIAIRKLVISHVHQRFSHEMFTAAAQLLMAGKSRFPERIKPEPEPMYLRGVSGYNNAVIYALTQGLNVTILATSGAQLLGDRDFWTALQSPHASVEILLLDPDFAPGIDKRQSAYADARRPNDYLRDEINQVVQLVKRMCKELNLDGGKLTLGFYKRNPEFKLACINKRLIYAAPYKHGSLTSEDTLFDEIREKHALFTGFEVYLDNVRASAETHQVKKVGT